MPFLGGGGGGVTFGISQYQHYLYGREFIKGRAPGKLTSCEQDLAINLPAQFRLLFLLPLIGKTKNAQLKNPTDLLHKNLMKPLVQYIIQQQPCVKLLIHVLLVLTPVAEFPWQTYMSCIVTIRIKRTFYCSLHCLISLPLSALQHATGDIHSFLQACLGYLILSKRNQIIEQLKFKWAQLIDLHDIIQIERVCTCTCRIKPLMTFGKCLGSQD